MYPPIKFVSHSTSKKNMGSYTAGTGIRVAVCCHNCSKPWIL